MTKLRRSTKSELTKKFKSEEVNLIWEVAKRKPISEDTLQRLVEECDWKCCVCWDYSKSSPIIVHHIEEHSKSHDDSYDNLVVLCLNHHAEAHSKWEISRHPLPPNLIHIKKREWIKALADFKAGHRRAPGDEDDIKKPPLESLEISQQREAELQIYLDKIQELLMEQNLRKSLLGDEVRNVARMQTLAVIRRLDGMKKSFLVQHLYELRLILETAIINLHDADLSGVYLDSVELSKVNLSGADLTGASLRWTNLEEADLHHCILIEATMWSTLKRANLRGAILHRADLRAADLRMADLGWADLFEASLREANLKGTNLSGVDLSRTNLNRTSLGGAKFNRYTRWPDGFDYVSAGAIFEDTDNLGP